jgi:DNA mismatch endonuclease, patch repair protein
MTDIVDKQTRSRMMSSVRAKNTKLEIEVRRRLFAMGFRYRLHRRTLPGTPDIVFPKYSTVVLVNGCFWHNHGCGLSSLPGTRRTWWKKKLEHNRLRDDQVVAKLRELGWRVLMIWECSFRQSQTNRSDALDKVASQAGRFLKSRESSLEISQLSRCRQNRKG